MSPPSPRLEAEALLRAQPFSPALEISAVDPPGDNAHSGTACFVRDPEGRRYKVRVCPSAARAREIERLVGLLPSLCPRIVARRGDLLLIEALDDHRPLAREEFLARVGELGAMVARAHEAAARGRLPGRLARARAELRARFQLLRDLRRVRRAGALGAASMRALRRKLRRGRRRFGLPIALELDDLHKANLMLREVDGDLRYVDEEGVALRPLGTSLASLVKSADREEDWRAFRSGYEAVRAPAWITPEYTEFVVLLDTLRKVANKLGAASTLDAERLEKLPAEIEDLERVARRSEVTLDQGIQRG